MLESEALSASSSMVLPIERRVIKTRSSEGVAPSLSFGISGPSLLGRPSWVKPRMRSSSLGLSGFPLNHLVKPKRTAFRYFRVSRGPLVVNNFSTKMNHSLEKFSIRARELGTISLAIM
jgi:hypothetical protein